MLIWLPARQRGSQAVACCFGVKRTLTLSAQWFLQKPWDGGLGNSSDTITPAGGAQQFRWRDGSGQMTRRNVLANRNADLTPRIAHHRGVSGVISAQWFRSIGWKAHPTEASVETIAEVMGSVKFQMTRCRQTNRFNYR
jgi:hypothetical protein